MVYRENYKNGVLTQQIMDITVLIYKTINRWEDISLQFISKTHLSSKLVKIKKKKKNCTWFEFSISKSKNFYLWSRRLLINCLALLWTTKIMVLHKVVLFSLTLDTSTLYWYWGREVLRKVVLCADLQIKCKWKRDHNFSFFSPENR